MTWEGCENVKNRNSTVGSVGSVGSEKQSQLEGKNFLLWSTRIIPIGFITRIHFIKDHMITVPSF